MFTSHLLRQMAVLSLLTVLTSAIATAQTPLETGRQRDGDRQGGRGFGGGWGGGMMRGPQIERATLLRSDKIRQELKVEEAQAATIDAALMAYQEERASSPRPDRDAFEKMTEEERTAYMEKSRKEREELSKKTDEILAAMLDEAQVKRLDQIVVQSRLMMSAVTALKADDMKQKLSITQEQSAKLDEAEKAAGAEMQKMFEEMRANGGGGAGGRGGNFEAMRTRMEEMRKKNTDAVMALLTDDQKTTLDSLKGDAFEMDMRSLMGGGRGGEGGGRGRGGRPPAE